MAVKNLTLPTFPVFDINEEPSKLYTSWKKYRTRFELLCSAVGVTEETQKLSMLLTYIGNGAYDIYEQIVS